MYTDNYLIRSDLEDLGVPEEAIVNVLQIVNEAYDRGHDSGYTSGHRDGHSEGRDEGFESGQLSMHPF